MPFGIKEYFLVEGFFLTARPVLDGEDYGPGAADVWLRLLSFVSAVLALATLLSS